VTAGIALVVAVAATVAVVLTSKSRPVPTPGATGAQPAAPATPTISPQCQALDAAIKGLSPRDKLAQLLMVGVKNLGDAQQVVHNQRVGGIFIGSWTDLSMMGQSLVALESEPRPIPLAVSVDEEGGRVQRLKSLIGPQLSPRDLVAAGKTPEQVREIAKERGLAMKKLGITIDFAPVVDTTAAGADTVIGDRSFSNDPQKVVTYAGAYADGLRDAGLLPVLKHFPGHGHASGDSHKTGVVTPPLSQLKTHDLIPYITLTQQQPIGVMIGHMQVPELTQGEQASLSPAAYDLLRKGGYGDGAKPFTGPIFTDDLSSMRAISDDYDVPTAVLMALKAGADTALWITTTQVPAVLDRLTKAVDSGELAATGVDDAVRHMAVVKNPEWSQCTA
jgi:beta-N-acetylhexosaminidase